LIFIQLYIEINRSKSMRMEKSLMPNSKHSVAAQLSPRLH